MSFVRPGKTKCCSVLRLGPGSFEPHTTCSSFWFKKCCDQTQTANSERPKDTRGCVGLRPKPVARTPRAVECPSAKSQALTQKARRLRVVESWAFQS